MAGKTDNFLGMSDDDFLKLGPSSLGSEEKTNSDENQGEDDASDSSENKTTSSDDTDSSSESDDDSESKETDEEDDDSSEEDSSKTQSTTGKESDKDTDKSDKNSENKEKSKDGETRTDKEITSDSQNSPVLSSKDMKPEELASFYDQVMKPFKANGREIQLRSAEEAIRLMQMGAGYGRKIQDIQPHLKTLRMLEKNNLLDQEKLGFLIDINSKNPEAIKKLIKDSGINPLDLDIDDNVDYNPTNHGVSDNEIAFTEALKEVDSQPGGRETIQHIHSTWDQKSKDFLWTNPEILTVIQEQRQNGIYDAITAEIDRKKMLGEINPNVPFLEAYKIAGDALVASKSLSQSGSKSSTQPPNRVLGTRAATPKSSAKNSDKAKAAGSPTSSSRKAKEVINPLDMADDDFMKQFENRL